jgi:hypothetical protein
LTAPSNTGSEFDYTAGHPPVPLAVWRTPRDAGAHPAQVSSSLAARLCAAYSRPAEPIIDAIGDPHVAAAAGAYGRRHLPATAYDLAHTLPVEQRITGLVLLRWPPAPADADQDDTVTVARVLSGTWWLLRRGGCLAVLAGPPEAAGGGLDLSTVVQAAHQIGYRYLQHVIAIDADIVDDQLHTDTVAAAPARHAPAHRDVLVFTRPGDHEPGHQ